MSLKHTPLQVGDALVLRPSFALEHLEHRNLLSIRRIAFERLQMHRFLQRQAGNRILRILIVVTIANSVAPAQRWSAFAISVPRRHPHRQPALRLGGELLHRPGLRLRHRVEAEARQEHGERDDRLLHGEGGADAHPRARSEG